MHGPVHVAEEVGVSVSLIGSSVVIEVVFLGAELIVVGILLHVLMLMHFMVTFSVSTGWWLCIKSLFHPLGIFRMPSPVLGS